MPFLSRFIKIIPIRLTIILTNKCNLKCSNCFEINQLNKPVENELSANEWIKIIDSLSRFTILDMLGGEIFLYKDLDRILNKCKEKNVLVALTTNASFLSKENIQKMFDYQVYYLMISVDGLGETHDKYRGKKNHFEQIVNTIKEINELKKSIKKNKPFICIKFLVMNQNISELVDFINYFEQIEGVDEIKFNFVTQKKYWYELLVENDLDLIFNESEDSYQFNEAAVNVFSKNLSALKYKVSHSKIKIGFQPKLTLIDDYVDFLKDKKTFATGVCLIPRSNFTILSNGDMIPCLSYNLGNIRNYEYKINNVLFNDNHKVFLKKQKSENLNDACRGCVTKPHEKIH